MKTVKHALAALSVILILAAAGCAGGPKELDNKGKAMGISTPDWVKTYLSSGVTKLQSQSEYRDKYCIIGEETGVNKQFVLAWADTFSAQQRIGAMLRTTIFSEYNARVQASAQSLGIDGVSSGTYEQQIDNIINAVVNVSYSGAQREADWWVLTRRYDPDVKDEYKDEYTAYVLYLIPKSQLNEQVARALETSVSRDSALYDITIQMAQQIFLEGMSHWGE